MNLSLTLTLALATGTALAAPRASVAAAKPLGCLIEPDRVADVGSQVVGLVERVSVERGDRVSAGQPLLTLRADVERANAGVAQTRSLVDTDVLAAQASLVLAEQKMRRAQSLLAENFVSEQALDVSRAELEMARQRLDQARSQQQVWGGEHRVAQAQLALRTVRSPFAGVVVERFVDAGERVEDKPVMRVAVINPLRVELMVPISLHGSLAIGDAISVRPELPGAGAVSAKVSHIDRVFDAASNTFRVRLSLPNPDGQLPAGLRCKADLPLTAAAPADAAPRLMPSSVSGTPPTHRPATQAPRL